MDYDQIEAKEIEKKGSASLCALIFAGSWVVSVYRRPDHEVTDDRNLP